MAVEGPEFERAFQGAIQYALNSGFSEILELRPVQQEARICGPANWMRQIFDISTCAESLFT